MRIKPTIPSFESVLTGAGHALDRLLQQPELLTELRARFDACHRDPGATLQELFRVDRELRHARQQCAEAARAATELERLLASLCTGSAQVCRRAGPLQRGQPATLLCELGTQLLELPVHPSVDLAKLERSEPWHLLRVHDRERVIVGIWCDEALFARALGEIVAFRAWFERDRGLVRVERQGQEDAVVTLAPSLRDREFAIGDQLVLMRGASSDAIAVVPAASNRSRFEVPAESFAAKLEDVAGFDSIVDSFVEDFILRVVYGDVRDRFGLEPLRGALLYSYKPGMGKTLFARALVSWLCELGAEYRFDVVCYVVKPGALRIVWHGGDAKLVREDLCGAIRERQVQPRTRPLVQIVVMDEVDSLGRRVGGEDGTPLLSAAQNDAVQALLAEMDGMAQDRCDHAGVPAHVVWLGLTNRPGSIDDALKRPGRFGDLVMQVPDATPEGAEAVLAVHARGGLPFALDGAVRTDLDEATIRTRLLRPAVARVFDAVVLRYSTEASRRVEVRAGELLANVHYKHALNSAKRAAARREVYGEGIPAIAYEDLVDGLVEQAGAAARGAVADRSVLTHQLRVASRITAVEAVPVEEIATHHYVRN